MLVDIDHKPKLLILSTVYEHLGATIVASIKEILKLEGLSLYI